MHKSSIWDILAIFSSTDRQRPRQQAGFILAISQQGDGGTHMISLLSQ